MQLLEASQRDEANRHPGCFKTFGLQQLVRTELETYVKSEVRVLPCSVYCGQRRSVLYCETKQRPYANTFTVITNCVRSLWCSIFCSLNRICVSMENSPCFPALSEISLHLLLQRCWHLCSRDTESNCVQLLFLVKIYFLAT